MNLSGGAINISEVIGCVTATSCNNQCPVGITDRCLTNICASREGSCHLNCNSVFPHVLLNSGLTFSELRLAFFTYFFPKTY